LPWRYARPARGTRCAGSIIVIVTLSSSPNSKNLKEMQFLDSPAPMVLCYDSMPQKQILIYPEQVLKSRAEEINKIDGDIITLSEDMKITMYAAPGVGLAAPQVGCSKRLILVDPTAGKDSGSLLVLINPVIVEREGSETDSEMCLSVPEMSVDVPRSARILVRAVGLNGKEVEFEAEGYLARIFQHEIDHLNGKVIFDYASLLKRSIYLKKRKKGKI
jgi:peptide deformylase